MLSIEQVAIAMVKPKKSSKKIIITLLVNLCGGYSLVVRFSSSFLSLFMYLYLIVAEFIFSFYSTHPSGYSNYIYDEQYTVISFNLSLYLHGFYLILIILLLFCDVNECENKMLYIWIYYFCFHLISYLDSNEVHCNHVAEMTQIINSFTTLRII